jgi:lipid-A-disaccharide synthase
VFYYISPKFWAWNYRRIHEIGRLTEMVLCILPFEEELYREAGYRARFVGHPLVDEALRLPAPNEARAALGLEKGVDCLALLPGSRIQEVRRLLPLMLRGLKRGRLDRQFRVLIPVARPDLLSPVRELLGRYDFDATLFQGRAMETLRASRAAVAASGTASLEAALAGCPAVVVYRVSISTYITARLLIRTPYMSLPNLILKRPLLTELLQHEVTPESIVRETMLLLGGDRRRVVLEGYQEMSDKLGPPGAPGRAAEIILERASGREQRAENS